MDFCHRSNSSQLGIASKCWNVVFDLWSALPLPLQICHPSMENVVDSKIVMIFGKCAQLANTHTRNGKVSTFWLVRRLITIQRHLAKGKLLGFISTDPNFIELTNGTRNFSWTHLLSLCRNHLPFVLVRSKMWCDSGKAKIDRPNRSKWESTLSLLPTAKPNLRRNSSTKSFNNLLNWVTHTHRALDKNAHDSLIRTVCVSVSISLNSLWKLNNAQCARDIDHKERKRLKLITGAQRRRRQRWRNAVVKSEQRKTASIKYSNWKIAFFRAHILYQTFHLTAAYPHHSHFVFFSPRENQLSILFHLVLNNCFSGKLYEKFCHWNRSKKNSHSFILQLRNSVDNVVEKWRIARTEEQRVIKKRSNDEISKWNMITK